MQKINGTSYHDDTPEKVVRVLEHCRLNRIRITLDYGDISTDESWGETCDITGYVGRSSGTVKIPLLLNNSRSLGGGGILDNRIISIRYANKKLGGYLYKLGE